MTIRWHLLMCISRLLHAIDSTGDKRKKSRIDAEMRSKAGHMVTQATQIRQKWVGETVGMKSFGRENRQRVVRGKRDERRRGEAKDSEGRDS